ncbi:MAG: tetratricopeptide repeat protein [Variovorax sp.]
MPNHPCIPSARAASAALLALCLLAPAWPADQPVPPGTDKLATVRASLAKHEWDDAIRELRNINDVSSADWNNLMGYSLRKSGSPDFAASERYYNIALRIDPQHRGALEYSGELYLMTGNLPKAEERMAALEALCVLPCAERLTLRDSIERYKAAGNRYESDY